MLYTTYQSKLTSPSTTPFRTLAYFNSTLPSGAIITITFDSSFSVPSTSPICSLRPTEGYGLPYIASCVSSSSSNTYTMGTVADIPAGEYILEVSGLQQDLAQTGFSLPGGVSFTIAISSSAQNPLYFDSNVLTYSPTAFRSFNVTQRDKIGLSNSESDFSLQLPNALSSSASNAETFLILQFPNPPFENDLGASNGTFSLDNITYYNGMVMPALFSSDFGSNTQATLRFGDSVEPPRIMIKLLKGLSTAQEALSIAYIKNPAAFEGISIDMYIVRYTSAQGTSASGIQTQILYEASYTNYFNTILEDQSLTANSQLLVGFSSLNPFQPTTMTLSGKNYGTDVDTSSKIYVKLRNKAQGFGYSNINSITCPGYTVQFFQQDYIFYLTPTSDQGPNPTIVCSGFVLGGSIQQLIVETGINKEGYPKTVDSIGFQLMQLAGSITNDQLQVSRLSTTNNFPNIGSVNLYQISYNPANFTILAGTSMILLIPSSLQVLPDRFSSATITGLVDRTSGGVLGAVSLLLNGTNLKIQGYDT